MNSRYIISPSDLKEFNYLKELKSEYWNLRFKVIKLDNKIYKQENQSFECNIVKKAKLELMKEDKDLFEEISCREMKDNVLNSFSHKLDLWNPIDKKGFEIQWHKSNTHKEIIKRMKDYKRLFGDVELIFLQFEDSQGWLRGYKRFDKLTQEKYKEANIKYKFMNIGQGWIPPLVPLENKNE